MKEKISSIIKVLKKSFERFPVTISIVFMITIIYTIAIKGRVISNQTLSNITLFAFIFSSSTFLIETIIQKLNMKKGLYYFLTAILSLILTFASNIQNSVFGMENSIFLTRTTRLIACYSLSAILFSIYFNYKNSHQSFSEYANHVVTNLFKASIIYGLLAIGVAIITSVFVFLILDGKDYSLILRIEILLLGFYYIPNVIYSFCNVDGKIGKFTKILVKYVLDPLVMISFIIIYLYIVKILITFDIPSNQIYRIITSLFVIGCPIWTMADYFKDDGILSKINKKLPILFTPFILLQIYSIGVRIINNGITEARYLCVMLIIFEIIYVIIYLKNKEKIGNIIPIIVAFIIISFIVPFVNMYKISEISQYNNLKIYKEKTSYTQEEKNKIRGAYYYLKNSEQGEKLIGQTLTEKDIKEITKIEDLKLSEQDRDYIYAYNNVDTITVQGYKKVYSFNATKVSKEIQDINNAFKNVKLNLEEEEKSIDLTNIIKDYILHEEDLYKDFKQNYEFELNEKQKVVLKRISITCDKEEQLISDYSITGYLLEK